MMTESAWLRSTDAQAMLRFLRMHPSGAGGHLRRPISDRQWRLFACACCRMAWDKLTDACSRKAVEVAEKFADDEATDEERIRACWEAFLVPDSRLVGVWMLAAECCGTRVAEQLHNLLPTVSLRDIGAANLLREIVGNPFGEIELPKARLSIPIGPWEVDGYTIDRGWGDEYCPWLTGEVLRLAEFAYQERPGKTCKCVRASRDGSRSVWAFCPTCNGSGTIDDGTLDPDTLAILADALEEAGCDNQVILKHLRERTVPGVRRCPCGGEYTALKRDRFPLLSVCTRCHKDGPFWHDVHAGVEAIHVRGCWVLDLLLGKESRR